MLASLHLGCHTLALVLLATTLTTLPECKTGLPLEGYAPAAL